MLVWRENCKLLKSAEKRATSHQLLLLIGFRGASERKKNFLKAKKSYGNLLRKSVKRLIIN
jgi:hypothetical protein